MWNWIISLSWLQLCWLIYGVALLLYGLLAINTEHHARKVDGASGWMLFSWVLLAAYGLLLLLVLSAIHWFLRR